MAGDEIAGKRRAFGYSEAPSNHRLSLPTPVKPRGCLPDSAFQGTTKLLDRILYPPCRLIIGIQSPASLVRHFLELSVTPHSTRREYIPRICVRRVASPYCDQHERKPLGTDKAYQSHIGKCKHRKRKLREAQTAARENDERERVEEQQRAAEELAQQQQMEFQVRYSYIHKCRDKQRVQEPPRPPTPVRFRVTDGRPIRKRRAPQRYAEAFPEPPPPAPAPAPAPPRAPSPSPDLDAPPDNNMDVPPRWVITKPNRFGVYKIYVRAPTHDPDPRPTRDDEHTGPWYKPFENSTQAEFMRYFTLVDNKNSIPSGNELIQLMLNPAFKPVDMQGFTVEKGFKVLDTMDATPPGAPPNGWSRGSVTLQVPPGRATDKDILEITLTDILFRSPLDIIREAFCTAKFEPQAGSADADADATSSPLDDCRLPELPPGHQELFGEMYTAHRTLQSYQKLPPCEEEAVVVSLMPYSDGTHLAQFGTASLQPGYLFLGNQSKSERVKPTANAAYHFVYFPTLPDDLDETFRDYYGHNINADIKAHLKRELFHAVWALIIDDEFVEAYIHGFPEECWDKILRRFFPRIPAYSMDYMEKILAATIKFLARCPCPRCLVLKANIHNTGKAHDLKRRQELRTDDIVWRNKVDNARHKIFDLGKAVNGKPVNRALGNKSFVPIKNAFGKLTEAGADFNLFEMFVPDLLHEIELGVFKSVFIHMIRLLYAIDKRNVIALDERFRKILPFGRATIRRFTGNVSEMKKLAARDFEDILQCLLPVAQGLFGDFDELVQQLVFQFQVWHAFAKLRLHTSATIERFQDATTALCATIRKFARDTAGVDTRELPREQAAQARQAAAKAAKRAASGGDSEAPAHDAAPVEQRVKMLNLNTYKFHCLPDYPTCIPDVGTTDSISTQPGESAHTKLKRLYGNTNRRRNFVQQIAVHERRIRLMRAIDDRKERTALAAKKAQAALDPEAEAEGPVRKKRKLTHGRKERFRSGLRMRSRLLPYTGALKHHYISDSTRKYWLLDDIPGAIRPRMADAALETIVEVGGAASDEDDGFEDEAEDTDPACRDFVYNCRAHLRWCLDGKPLPKPEYSPEDLLEVGFRQGRMFLHATCKLNFTTYDLQRDQDIISPRSRPNVMMLSQDPDDAHPYCYKRVEYLYVRWYVRHPLHACLPEHPGMPMVSFVSYDSPDSEAFGFIDPNVLVRGAHIIPAFDLAQTDELLPPSVLARPLSDEHQDWMYYYVNGVVDRDIFMRYQRDAVGHSDVWAKAGPSCNLGAGVEEESDEDLEEDGVVGEAVVEEEEQEDEEEREDEQEVEDEQEEQEDEDMEQFWDSEEGEDELVREGESGGEDDDEEAPLVGDDAEYGDAGVDPA
ncbi:hypothetical protein MKEN_00289800 [Mycena kentingensis (nom. inval.)]|nr:hypothetical protein MKEN_00289800 [Mycena kentingensis (nom. inval.)]